MFRHASLLLLLVACGGAENHDSTLPPEDASGCPADPDKCSELAASAASSGKPQLAWAYTVLACGSQNAAQCAPMWGRYSNLAPTQTDALNVLHAACDHAPGACAQLASWHAARGHTLAAAAYQKRAAGPQPSRSANAVALATDLATLMHVSAPRTDSIAQMVGHELHGSLAAAKPARKAWSMHAAELGMSSDGCTSTALLDRKDAPLEKCISEVKPLQGDEIALRNRCSVPVFVAYSGARGDRSTVGNAFRLERYEARSIGVSHREVGTLTYAVCSDSCKVNGVDTVQWTANDAVYTCARGAGL